MRTFLSRLPILALAFFLLCGCKTITGWLGTGDSDKPPDISSVDREPTDLDRTKHVDCLLFTGEETPLKHFTVIPPNPPLEPYWMIVCRSSNPGKLIVNYFNCQPPDTVKWKIAPDAHGLDNVRGLGDTVVVPDDQSIDIDKPIDVELFCSDKPPSET